MLFLFRKWRSRQYTAVILEASDHSRRAGHTCALKIIDHVFSGNIALFGEEIPLHI